MTITTRSLAILALLLSSATCVLTAVAFFGRSAPTPRALAQAPTASFRQALDGKERDALAVRAYYAHLGPDVRTYTHPRYSFSFPYYADFRLAVGSEEGGELILIEHPELPMAFQLFVQPFDEPAEALTVERIRRDLPNFPMQAPTQGVLPDGTSVLRFTTPDPVVGELREAWFVHDNLLYQLTMHAPDAEVLDAWLRDLLMRMTFPALEPAHTPV